MGKAEDRISNLPDSILHHILSFLPTETVARTSILSHRWKHIWISIPNLEFECENPFHILLGLGKSKYGFKRNEFMNFVNGTLDRYSSSNNIQKFSFNSWKPVNESHVILCISKVLRHNNLKELSLSLHQVKPLCFPPSVFTCASLISLDLDLQVRHDTRFPGNISFPRLKRLRLGHFKLSNDCWNDKLFSNSPVLEELYLDSCVFLLPNFCIAIPTLRVLKINRTEGIENCALKIHAPNLLNLFYKGHVAKEYVLSGFSTIVEAVFEVYGKLGDRSADEAVSQIFRALAHVKCLTVNVPPPENLPTYHNLKHLNMTRVPPSSDVRVIALLKVAPNLESLVIEKASFFEHPPSWMLPSFEDEEDEDNFTDNHGNEDDGWTSLDMVAIGSLFLHLKSFCFRPSIWDSSEISCVKAILRNAKALQSLTIYFNDFNFLDETEQEIQSFPRASPCCMIKICPEQGN